MRRFSILNRGSKLHLFVLRLPSDHSKAIRLFVFERYHGDGFGCPRHDKAPSDLSPFPKGTGRALQPEFRSGRGAVLDLGLWSHSDDLNLPGFNSSRIAIQSKRLLGANEEGVPELSVFENC